MEAQSVSQSESQLGAISRTAALIRSIPTCALAEAGCTKTISRARGVHARLVVTAPSRTHLLKLPNSFTSSMTGGDYLTL